MAYKGFSPKALFQALDIKFVQEFFERFLPNQASGIDWTKDEFSRQYAIDVYNALPNDNAEKHRVGGDLEDIFFVFNAPSVSNDVVRQVENALREELPEDVRDLEVENVVMWVYLNRSEAWQRLVHVTRATTLPTYQWHTYQLVPEQGKAIESGFRADALEVFKREVARLLKRRKEGLAESVDVEISEVKGCEQVVCYVSNNLRSQTQMEQGKKVDKTVNLPQEAYFCYSPEHRTLAIHYPGARRSERDNLCTLFAQSLKGAKRGDEVAKGVKYRLNQLAKERQLEVPSGPDVIEALVIEVRYRLPNKHIISYDTSANPEDARSALVEKLQPSRCNLAVSDVIQVKIRVRLSDRFERRKQQTLTITETGCDLGAKDSSVQEPLLRCLKTWGIVAC